MKIARAFIFPLLIAVTASAKGAESSLWRGGIWNLDYPGDVSTYGWFRLTMEKDHAQRSGHVVKVEWVERQDDGSERIIASRLIPELDKFIQSGGIKAQDVDSLPSAVRLENKDGNVVWLRLWEPTRYEVQDLLK